MKKVYQFSAKVWLWPGDVPWHFVSIPDDISLKIRSENKGAMVKVCSTIGDTSWNGSLFWSKNSNRYIMPIKKEVRNKEGIFAGEEVLIKYILA
jgi:hypothetical protein